MQTSNEIKRFIRALINEYYDVEEELKELNNYEIGDKSEEDFRSSKLVLYWINLRTELFYQRFRLAKSYINNL